MWPYRNQIRTFVAIPKVRGVSGRRKSDALYDFVKRRVRRARTRPRKGRFRSGSLLDQLNDFAGHGYSNLHCPRERVHSAFV
ncbi:hypothetical protein EVAR_22727_1 [Eumeta japonica]|uniref:Uncharacterized protein n=1 Tax=Eumeta variegata TaxID=151549 RepID=A0A4C1USC7_EUMVA|nr:hypothetical protein EVAR_22727_1 [Eumeta japonica]